MRNITKISVGLSALLFTVSTGVTAYAQQYHEDQDFADWVTEKCPDVPLSKPADRVDSSQDTSVGNNAPSLKVEHNWISRIAGCHLKKGATIEFTDNVAVSLQFRFEGKYSGGGSNGMALAPLIKQDGKYFAPKFKAFAKAGFTKWDVKDFVASDFFPIYRPDSDEHPDFSCGASKIEVGILSANQGAGTRTAHVDNWSVKANAGDSCKPKAADYLCYDLLAYERENYTQKERRRALKDQFGSLNVELGHPVSICNPVDLNGEEVPSTDDHYVCYTVHDNLDQSQQIVEIENALEINRLRTGRSGELCLRSSKKHLDR